VGRNRGPHRHAPWRRLAWTHLDSTPCWSVRPVWATPKDALGAVPARFGWSGRRVWLTVTPARSARCTPRADAGDAVGAGFVEPAVQGVAELAQLGWHCWASAVLDELGEDRSRPGRQQAALRRDPMITQHTASPRAAWVRAAHPMLAPRQVHRRAEHRQVHVPDHRAFLHPHTATAARTPRIRHHRLDHQIHLRPTPLVIQNADVLQPDQRLDNLARLGHDEGASNLLAHTSSLRRLRPLSGQRRPAQIRRACFVRHQGLEPRTR
jgi:hypothetical protein